MSQALLEALRTHLLTDTTLKNSVDGGIFTIETESRAGLPLLYAFEESPLTQNAYGGVVTHWSVVRFAIVVDAGRLSDGITAKTIANTIWGYLETFLKASKTFSATGYDRGIVKPLSPGSARLETFEQQQLLILDPSYEMQGTKF